MKLEVFEKYSRERIGMVKMYTYASYTDELNGKGEFSIRMPVEEDSVSYLSYGNYVLFDEGVVGVVQGMRNVEGDESEVEVYGSLTNVILSYRSTFLVKRYYGTVPEIMRRMTEDLFISPDDRKRAIDFVMFPDGDEWFPQGGKKQTFQSTGKDLLEILSGLAMTNDLAFCLYPVVEDYAPDGSVLTNLSRMEFRIRESVDRTLGNEHGRDPVVFSFDLNNLESLEYEEDGREYRTMALVAAEGQGQERKTLEVGDLDKEGIDRIEFYVDARDIQSSNGSSGSDGEGGGDGSGIIGSSEKIWKPEVSTAGDISWELSGSATKPATRNIKGPAGNPGEDGFSPTIRPNTSNTQEEYRLDVSTKDGTFTTPNLKGQKGDSGPQGPTGPQGPAGDASEALNGLVFGQDSEGNWGYIPPGADTVVPFKKGGGDGGGGSGVEVKDWPNPAIFHPAVKLLGVSAVEVEADVVVGSEWKKVDA